MNLKDQGFRFMVKPSHVDVCKWVHPAEVSALGDWWTDCTDMNDSEFFIFMTSTLGKPK